MMHVSSKGYLDCCPEVYTKIRGSLQEELERVVKKELLISLEREKEKEDSNTDD